MQLYLTARLLYLSMRRQHGIGVQGAIYLLALLALIFGGYRAVMTFFSHESMREELRSRADDALLDPRLDLAQIVVDRVGEVDPQFSRKSLLVEFSENRDAVHMQFTYQRPMDLLLMQWPVELNVDFTVDRRQQATTLKNVTNSLNNSAASSEERLKSQLKP